MRLNHSLFGLLATAFALQAASAQPVTGSQAAPPSTSVVELPRPTGRFPVGTDMVVVADPYRREIFTPDPADQRRVSVQIYYPAAKGCGPQSYVPSPLADVIRQNFRAEKGFERRLKAYACNDANPAGGSEKFPLVLFSHGMGTSHYFYVSLLEDLASRGNIVVAVDHTHGPNATYFADGSLVLKDRSRWGIGAQQIAPATEYYRNWAEDVRSVLDRIFRNDGTVLSQALGKRLDLGRVAYMGHSYGGLAAIYAAQMDSRIKGAVNLDGGVGATGSAEAPPRLLLPVETDVPILVLNSQDYDERASYAQSVRVTRLRGTSHMTFSDVIWLHEQFEAPANGPPPPPGALPGAEGIRLTRDLASLFLTCAFTQDCARLDSALDAARTPADEKPAK